MTRHAQRCGGCGRGVVRLKRTSRAICRDCQRIANNKKMAERRAAQPRPISMAIKGYTLANAVPRQRADRAIARGRTNRRCQCCYTLYHLDTLETPCPSCGAHLSDLPFPLQERSHVAS